MENLKREASEAIPPSAEKSALQPGWMRKGIGQFAVEGGFITEQQLSLALREQEKTGKPLTDLLQERYGISAETVQYLLAREAGIEQVDLSKVAIEREAIDKVAREFAAERKLIPISLSQDRKSVV